jgi:hypothetical protein
MQSFKLHVVSEHLKARHPYLELEFRDRYDPSEVIFMNKNLKFWILILF